MSTERDEGLEALRNRETATAVAKLEEAVRKEPHDYQAFMYLGAAYSQAGRKDDAVTTLTTAVQLQPADPQARYNLGVALERAGWREQAMTALQQAVQLKPDYTAARDALARLQQPAAPPKPPAASTAEPPPEPPPQPPAEPVAAAPAEAQDSSPAETASGEPDASPQSAAAASEAPIPLAVPRPAPPVAAEPTQAYPAPAYQPAVLNPSPATGYHPPARSLDPSVPTQMYPQPPVTPYAYAPGYGQPYAQVPSVPDKFNLWQGFVDWSRSIITPGSLFSSQYGRTGIKAPVATWLAYVIVQTMAGAIAGWIAQGPQAAAYLPQNINRASVFTHVAERGPGGEALVTGGLGALLIVSFALYAWALHGVARRLFGGTGSRQGAFRAIAYASGPSVALTCVGIVLSGIMGQAYLPVGPAVLLASMVWTLALTVVGLHHTENITASSAIGVIIVAVAALCGLVVGIVLAVLVIILVLSRMTG